MAETSTHSLARILKVGARVEPAEVKAVVLGFLYFFFLLGSYYILRPVRDAMATSYGPDPASLSQLYTGTFIGTLIIASLFAAASNRIKLQTLLPWAVCLTVLTRFLKNCACTIPGRPKAGSRRKAAKKDVFLIF